MSSRLGATAALDSWFLCPCPKDVGFTFPSPTTSILPS